MREKRRRRERKVEKEERRWSRGEFSHDDFARDRNNLHRAREEGGEIKQERENTRLSLTREGGVPFFVTENFLPSR